MPDPACTFYIYIHQLPTQPNHLITFSSFTYKLQQTQWFAENATNAYLRTSILQGQNPNEPNGAEFISALAAGNNAQFVVVACGAAADSTTLALAAAAQQTGGRIVCILPDEDKLYASRVTLESHNATNVEFAVGDAKELLLSDLAGFSGSDFVAVDCNLESHESIITGLQEKAKRDNNNTIVMGYNAFCRESWRNSDLKTQLLPIADDLLLSKSKARKSNWVVKVDKYTGE